MDQFIGVGSQPTDIAPAADQLRVGVIGYGYWGPNLSRNLSALPASRLAAVADMQADRLDMVAATFPQARLYTDYREMLESDIQAVVVATPIHTHHRVAKDALLAGKHVLVEKPFATSVEDAIELRDIAEARGLVAMVGHTFVYNPAVIELKRIVRSGDMGRILHVDAARLNLGLFSARSNVVWDLAPHDLSILTFVFGELPAAVSARGNCCVIPGVHDVVYMDFEFESGMKAQVHVSWLDPVKVRRFTVVGSKKMVVYSEIAADDKVKIFDKGVDVDGEFSLNYRNGEVSVAKFDWREPLSAECEDFVRAATTGQAPVADAAQGVQVVALLEAIDRSLKGNGQWVAIDEEVGRIRSEISVIGELAAI